MPREEGEQKPMASAAIRGASQKAEEHLSTLSKVVRISSKSERSHKQANDTRSVKRSSNSA